MCEVIKQWATSKPTYKYFIFPACVRETRGMNVCERCPQNGVGTVNANKSLIVHSFATHPRTVQASRTALVEN